MENTPSPESKPPKEETSDQVERELQRMSLFSKRMLEALRGEEFTINSLKQSLETAQAVASSGGSAAEVAEQLKEAQRTEKGEGKTKYPSDATNLGSAFKAAFEEGGSETEIIERAKDVLEIIEEFQENNPAVILIIKRTLEAAK